MNEIQLLTQIVSKLDVNQMALQVAVGEIALWIRQRGSENIADNVAGALQMLTTNAPIIAPGITEQTNWHDIGKFDIHEIAMQDVHDHLVAFGKPGLPDYPKR